MQLYLRDADASDLAHLIALLTEADDPLDVDGFDHVGDYADALREIERHPGTYVLVADYSGAAVGMVQLATVRGLAHRGGRSAIIETLVVAEPWRRRGVGRDLVEHAVGRATDLGCHEIRLMAPSAGSTAIEPFARSVGFEPSSAGLRRSLDRDWTPTRSAQYRWSPDAVTVD